MEQEVYLGNLLVYYLSRLRTGTLMDWENCLTLAAKTGDVVKKLILATLLSST